MIDILDSIDNDLKFTQRPTAVPIGTRMSYRIAQICLILYFGNEGRQSSSILKIQLTSNALFNLRDWNELVQYTKLGGLNMMIIPRVDPCVNTALQFAIKYGLCIQAKTNQRYKLTGSGKHYCQAIIEEGIMKKETCMLQELGTSLTEDIINHLY